MNRLEFRLQPVRAPPDRLKAGLQTEGGSWEARNPKYWARIGTMNHWE
jgi:hypothetical protein